MIQPLLTIAIPTFNRAPHLDLLLSTLTKEVAELNINLEIIVSDNASTDQTSDICQSFRSCFPSISIYRNAINLGAENNFFECFSKARGRYFWIIGDDDLPKFGVIQKIIKLLTSNNPDLIYLESEWLNTITSPNQGCSIDKLDTAQMPLEDLIVKINVWLTFASALIINRELFLKNYFLHDAKRFFGTNILQLAWVFGVLKHGHNFIYVKNRCMLATADNSGGYDLVRTFGINFPKVVLAMFSENNSLARKIIRRCLISHTPGIIWKLRFKNDSNFNPEIPWVLMNSTLKSYYEYWLLIFPISNFPKIISWFFLQFSYAIVQVINWKSNRRHKIYKSAFNN